MITCGRVDDTEINQRKVLKKGLGLKRCGASINYSVRKEQFNGQTSWIFNKIYQYLEEDGSTCS